MAVTTNMTLPFVVNAFSIAQQKASWQRFWLREPVVSQPAREPVVNQRTCSQPTSHPTLWGWSVCCGSWSAAAGLQGTSLCQLWLPLSYRVLVGGWLFSLWHC